MILSLTDKTLNAKVAAINKTDNVVYHNYFKRMEDMEDKNPEWSYRGTGQRL